MSGTRSLKVRRVGLEGADVARRSRRIEHEARETEEGLGSEFVETD